MVTSRANFQWDLRLFVLDFKFLQKPDVVGSFVHRLGWIRKQDGVEDKWNAKC